MIIQLLVMKAKHIMMVHVELVVSETIAAAAVRNVKQEKETVTMKENVKMEQNVVQTIVGMAVSILVTPLPAETTVVTIQNNLLEYTNITIIS